MLILLHAATKPFPLMVGDAAPKLQVSSWIKGDPVTEFKKGQVYLIETWATWCQPCLHYYPHLSELQKQYGNRLTVIGVSVWEQQPESVKPFVARMGSKMDYRVATDVVPAGKSCYHGLVSDSWIIAAGKYSEGIPCTFIVDQDGKLAWIGHPSDVEQPLSKIVSKQWNLAVEAENYRKLRLKDVQSEPIIMDFYDTYSTGDIKQRVADCEKLLNLDAKRFGSYAAKKFDLLYGQLDRKPDAIAFAKQSIEKEYAASAAALSALSGSLLATGQSDLFPLALKAAETAAKLDGEKDPWSLQAYSYALFRTGDKKKAIEKQRLATELAPPEYKQDFQAILDSFAKH